MGRLLRIEVENFKSYKGTQTIGPFHNFTSVIGPNGSGKSNLMDAISFVLGVKSKELRSTQLKELLYHSGMTQDGEPPIRRAHVMAVYETSDGEELRFMRALSGTGTSEYRINNKVVTFADYSKALEKENILIKAKNFLVFQGEVEAIASQKAMDLTRMIEQISGSLELKAEYERLKDEQEKATETSAQNFNKKRGITAEMKQFKEQKEEAERYEHLLEQRDDVIMHHLLWKLYHIDKKIGELEEEVANEKGSLDEFTERMTELENNLKAAKREQAKTNKELMRREKKLKDKTKELDERKPELTKLDEDLKHGKRKLAAAEDNLVGARKEQERQTKVISGLENDKRLFQRRSDEFEESEREKAANQGPALGEAALAEYSKKKQEVGRRTFAEKQDLNNLERQMKLDTDKRERLAEDVKTAQTREATLMDERSVLETRKRRKEADLSEMSANLRKAEEELQRSGDERKRLGQMEKEKNEQLMDVDSRLTNATLDRRESEREHRTKETLEALRRIYPGVHGRVVDLIQPTQQKYNLAVSTTLGRHMDSVVVDNERIAIDCIQYLREQRTGPWTFLPLDTIQVKPLIEKYRNYVKGARLAIDIIQFDDAYQRALQHICGNTVVCDTADIAKHIVYEKRQEVKAVSLDGTVIHKTGLITGGQYGNSQASRRWEEKDIENMRKTRDALNSQINDLQKQRKALPDDDHLRTKYEDLNRQRRGLADDLATTDRKLDGAQKELDHLAAEIAKFNDEIKELSTAIEASQERIQEVDATIKVAENEIFADFCRQFGISNIREYEETHMRSSQEAKKKRMEFTTHIAKLDSQISFEKRQASDKAEQVAKLEATIATDRTNVKDLEEQKKTFEADTAELQEEIEQIQEDLDVAKQDLEEKNEGVSKAKKEVSRLNKEMEGKNKQIGGKEAEIEKNCAERFSIFRRCRLEEIDLPLQDGAIEDITLEEIEEALGADEEGVDGEASQSQSQSREKLKSIGINFSKLKKDERQNGTEEMNAKFQDKIKEMTAEIEKMAPNMRAVDKLDEVESKLRATAQQFDNARKEAKSARDAFNKIKEERFDRFMDAYNHISENISVIYKDLTKSKIFPTGGQAYLNLEDSEEPYNSGIKFHAMPPGKRFREMENLSGGEKTVAALALVFAIHSFQPAPFFVLDEVDAALDNTNVAKVADYIRRNASDTFQFIVISLKNTFYEKAEALVGIYRDQQEGSSRCLTMQMKDRFEE
ncbi:Structural maintenance of chromosomes protein 1 [Rhizophlyctis rosea]|uniref:Structural maintenance of chromosomes protein n=1 Tax=Rhizophlyctis rosea TaxID=64517 RepID=A0AAD5X6D8_9FUNG|nr:Structural maintenance of chromosomes protein 1 [Rhizophlyctis rosea]